MAWTCNKCGAPGAWSEQKQKYYCSAKCWLNTQQQGQQGYGQQHQAPQQYQQPQQQRPAPYNPPRQSSKSPHETRSIIIQAMIKTVGMGFDWEKNDSRVFAERVKDVIALHDFLIAQPKSPPVNFGAAPGPVDETRYNAPPPDQEPPDWTN